MGCKYFHKDFVEISFHYKGCTSHLVPLAKGLLFKCMATLKISCKLPVFSKCNLQGEGVWSSAPFLLLGNIPKGIFFSFSVIQTGCQIQRFISFLETLAGHVS